ncbi:XRE family transcriptional regulator [Staphylococcus coagulans]|uniref:XRE family transcriptional regulator n=1 Tax=Staphylococcus coagulans TaxID=74706 RepID=UPI001FD8FFED|nr:XRE family transcriptional regulator [Staphylococcus coagulans]
MMLINANFLRFKMVLKYQNIKTLSQEIVVIRDALSNKIYVSTKLVINGSYVVLDLSPQEDIENYNEDLCKKKTTTSKRLIWNKSY